MLNRRQMLLAASSICLTARNNLQAAPAPSLRIRRGVNGLAAGHPVVQGYANAVSALKNLPANNLRNWTKLAEIHNYRCPHENWFFLPWHRAYLCQFEKICADVTGDPNFALPYWDWTGSANIPSPFLDAASPLYDSTRRNQSIPSSTVQRRNIDRILGIGDFETFGSTRSDTQRPMDRPGTGDLEGGPHNAVHGRISGDMGNFMSPLDPIFWLHHCNIDRLWDSWLAQNHKTDPALASSGYEFKYVGGEPTPAPNDYMQGDFIDAQGNRVLIKCSDAMDSAGCGYAYDRLEAPSQLFVAGLVLPKGAAVFEPNSLVTSPNPGGTPLKSMTPASLTVELDQNARALKIGAAVPALRAETRRDLLVAQYAEKSALTPQTTVGRVVATITLSGAIPDTTTMRVFVNCPYLSSETPISDPHFVTEIASFGAHEMHDAPARFRFDLTDSLAEIGGVQDSNVNSIRVQLLPIGEDPKIALRSVSIRII